MFVKSEYINRHNTIAKYICWKIYCASNFECSSVWWNYHQLLNLIKFDKAIFTDLSISTKRPDITFNDKVNKHTLFIDVSHPFDSNAALKQTEVLSNYKFVSCPTSRNNQNIVEHIKNKGIAVPTCQKLKLQVCCLHDKLE